VQHEARNASGVFIVISRSLATTRLEAHRRPRISGECGIRMDRANVIRKPPIILDGRCLDDPPSAGSSNTGAPAARRRHGIKGQWFTRPLHLGGVPHDVRSAGEDAASLAGLSAAVPRPRPLSSVNGLLGAFFPPPSSTPTTGSHHPADTDHDIDELLLTYFPLTLMISDDAGPSAATSLPPADLSTSGGNGTTSSGSRSTSGRRRSRTSAGGGGQRRSRPGSTRSSSSSATSNGLLDRIYLTSNNVSADILGIIYCFLGGIALRKRFSLDEHTSRKRKALIKQT